MSRSGSISVSAIGRRISEGRQAKYLDLLKIPLEFWKKPTVQLRMADLERFEKSLTSDQIQSPLKGKPFAHATKNDIRRALKIFLRWRLGEAKAAALAGWLDTRDRKKTPDYMGEKEVEALFKACASAEQRFLIAVLFDSGARAEEFINIRYEDIALPEGKDYVKLTLKEEYSKTLGRTISLYWRHSLEAVRDYLQERAAAGIKSQDPVFANTYDAMRMFLARLGKKVLQKHVHPHLFRHSSATHYATKLNRQELCYRYGWRFSSNMPDVYISRAGMESKELDQKFTNTELGTLKDQLTKLEQETKIKDDRVQELQRALDTMRQEFSSISRIVQERPATVEVEQAIQRKRRGAQIT